MSLWQSGNKTNVASVKLSLFLFLVEPSLWEKLEAMLIIAVLREATWKRTDVSGQELVRTWAN